MLIHCEALECFAEYRDHLGKHWGTRDGLRADAMHAGEQPLLYLWVDICLPRDNGIVLAHAGNANLADAAAVVVSGLDIERGKSKRAFGECRQTAFVRIRRSCGRCHLAEAKRALALTFYCCLFPLAPAQVADGLIDQLHRLIINCGLVPIPRYNLGRRNGDHFSFQLSDVRSVGQDNPDRAAMAGDELVAQLLGDAAIRLGGWVEPLSPHPPSVVHGREIMAEVLRAGPVFLMDSAV